MKGYVRIVLIKIVLLFLALFFSVVLFLAEQNTSVQNSFIFVVDVSLSMNANDVNWDVSDWENVLITRLDLSKKYINTFVEKNPNVAVGLVLLWDELEYFLPVTNDTGTFLLYVNNLYATKQSSGLFVSDILSWVFLKENQKIMFFSDMDFSDLILRNKVWKYEDVLWFGVGSAEYVRERFADGVYVDEKKTIRNDRVARKIVRYLWWKYIILDNIDDIWDNLFVEDKFISFSLEKKYWYFVLVFVLILVV